MATFYTFLHHEKSNWLLNVHEKNFLWTPDFWISSELGILKENQLKDKYVTNKMEKV